MHCVNSHYSSIYNTDYIFSIVLFLVKSNNNVDIDISAHDAFLE
jgi:hypothetical protein